MDPVDLSPTLVRLAALIDASPHNLVSRTAREELLSRHIPESVHLAHQLPRSERALKLLDVGSGGGLPGLVIAAVRGDLEVELLESRQKKVAFLRAAAAELGLSVRIHHGRAEELQRTELAGSFDLVTARAVAPLDRLIPWTVPFLRPGGLFYAVKGVRWEEELEVATPVLATSGASVVETPRTAQVTIEGAPRVVLIARSAPRENMG